MLSANKPPRTPFVALTIAVATISLLAPAVASADDTGTAASNTQPNANAIGAIPPAVNAVTVNAPGSGDASSNTAALLTRSIRPTRIRRTFPAR